MGVQRALKVTIINLWADVLIWCCRLLWPQDASRSSIILPDCSVSSQMTERRAAAAATLLSSSSTGHRCFQEEYLEYSPCNDLPPSVRNEDRFPRRRRARGRKLERKEKEEREKNIVRNVARGKLVRQTRGGGRYIPRSLVNPIFRIWIRGFCYTARLARSARSKWIKSRRALTVLRDSLSLSLFSLSPLSPSKNIPGVGNVTTDWSFHAGYGLFYIIPLPLFISKKFS